MPHNYFDAPVAATYDERSPEMFAPEVLGPTVDFLVALADGGAALELGIGTGRVAVPLHARGVPVHGIDLSPDMVARLVEKPEAAGIGVTVGDFSTTTVDGTFRLAYLVFNTIANLTSQEEQVACFQNVAAHLEPGGRFVIELYLPELRRLPPGATHVVFDVGPTHVGIDEYDCASQTSYSHHFFVTDGNAEMSSTPFRYCWPAELDLMARLAGMTLQERWADWDRSPFVHESRKHVSVWQKTSG